MSESRKRGRPARRTPEPMAMCCEKRYSAEEASQVSSLSLRQIRRAIDAGQTTGGRTGLWPLEQCGRRVLIPATALDNWLKSFRLGDVA